jgi:hypothetical protein
VPRLERKGACSRVYGRRRRLAGSRQSTRDDGWILSFLLMLREQSTRQDKGETNRPRAVAPKFTKYLGPKTASKLNTRAGDPASERTGERGPRCQSVFQPSCSCFVMAAFLPTCTCCMSVAQYVTVHTSWELQDIASYLALPASSDPFGSGHPACWV